MKLTHCFVALSLVFSASALAQETDTWTQLGLVLKGARPGMPLADFLKNHPKAKGQGITADGKPVDATLKNASLEEHFDKDPFLGLWCLANYGFKDGVLYEFTLLWYGPADKALAARTPFYRACVHRHGKEFQREVMKVDAGTPPKHWAPVLVWSTDECATLAAYSLRKEPKKGVHGIFTYAVLPKGDPFLEQQLAARQMNAEELKHTYAGIEPVLEKVLKKEAKQGK